MYAVLQIPRLALQAVLRCSSVGDRGTRPLPTDSVAVVGAEVRKPVVLEMTKAAEREGVVAGLSVAQALARCGNLVVRHRSEQAEESVEELLLALAYSLSPRVEREGSGEALVDLRGTQMEVALERCGQIVGELAELGLVAGIGVAESWVMAGLAAKRVGRGVLVVVGCRKDEGGGMRDEMGSRPTVVARKRAMPVKRSLLQGETAPAERPRHLWSLEKPIHFVGVGRFMDDMAIGAVGGSETLLGVLQKWGVRTVSEFAKLERSAVGVRLGVEGLQLWDRVTGGERRVVAVRELPDDFEESWDFEYDVDSLDPVLFLLNRFLDTLCLRMRSGHKAAVLARMELSLAYGEPIVLEQKVPEATNDAAALFSLLASRLEEVDAESPVARVSLRLEGVDVKQRQLGLFESSLKNPYRFTQTLSRVAGIVGEDRVGRPVVAADGRPDGVRMAALPAAVPSVVDLDLGRMFGLPLRRFRPGLKAEVEFEGSVPVWVRSVEVSGAVNAARGPWLHSGHWWEESGSWNRVEWDVELSKGGVYRISKYDGGWNVEGEY